ncbi:Plug domain-containing protein [Sphingomonas aerolata]|uniref:Plug domain-containing protein n=1 Tax=Sphingomonas aerolata TaxID=185951 RepID=UPI002FE0051E
MKARYILLAGIAATSFATVAAAQTTPIQDVPVQTAGASDDTATTPAPIDGQDDIVVTAVARGTNRLNTSITTSSIGSDALIQLAPRTSGELLRNLPGIRVEASGGDGNANISVRGLPVASGGSKFLQLQEDGLPILEFGDITFGNADIFLRADFNVRTVEVGPRRLRLDLRVQLAGRRDQLHLEDRRAGRRRVPAVERTRLPRIPRRFRPGRQALGQRHLSCRRLLPDRRRPA